MGVADDGYMRVAAIVRRRGKLDEPSIAVGDQLRLRVASHQAQRLARVLQIAQESASNAKNVKWWAWVLRADTDKDGATRLASKADRVLLSDLIFDARPGVDQTFRETTVAALTQWHKDNPSSKPQPKAATPAQSETKAPKPSASAASSSSNGAARKSTRIEASAKRQVVVDSSSDSSDNDNDEAETHSSQRSRKPTAAQAKLAADRARLAEERRKLDAEKAAFNEQRKRKLDTNKEKHRRAEERAAQT